jgi:predicted transcriptional regulator
MTDLETSLLNAGAINDLLEKTVRRRVKLHADMGRQLKKWRDSSGMLGKDISKRLGISTAHYFNLEAGRQQFTTELINKALLLVKKD